jgi:hypothetical protein
MSEQSREVKFDRDRLRGYHRGNLLRRLQVRQGAGRCIFAVLVAALLAPGFDALAKDSRNFSDDAIELKVDCVPGEPGEEICATCVAKAVNRTEDVFGRGDITISVRNGVTVKVKASGGTKKVLPKGSTITNDDTDKPMKSADHVVQALKDNWKIGEEVRLNIEVAAEKGAACAAVELRVRAAGRPKEKPKTIIFVPAAGPKDQQGLPVVVKELGR